MPLMNTEFTEICTNLFNLPSLKRQNSFFFVKEHVCEELELV